MPGRSWSLADLDLVLDPRGCPGDEVPSLCSCPSPDALASRYLNKTTATGLSVTPITASEPPAADASSLSESSAVTAMVTVHAAAAMQATATGHTLECSLDSPLREEDRRKRPDGLQATVIALNRAGVCEDIEPPGATIDLPASATDYPPSIRGGVTRLWSAAASTLQTPLMGDAHATQQQVRQPLSLKPDEAFPIPVVSGPFLDIEIAFLLPSAPPSIGSPKSPGGSGAGDPPPPLGSPGAGDTAAPYADLPAVGEVLTANATESCVHHLQNDALVPTAVEAEPGAVCIASRTLEQILLDDAPPLPESDRPLTGLCGWAPPAAPEVEVKDGGEQADSAAQARLPLCDESPALDHQSDQSEAACCGLKLKSWHAGQGAAFILYK